MRLWMMFTFIVLITTTPLFALEKVIYGSDNRVDVFEATDLLHIELASSTAAQISSEQLRLNSDKSVYKLKGKTLRSAQNICKTERFANQTVAARCSGFLVAPDLLVTAGHCVKELIDCLNNSWVFDFKLSGADSEIINTLPAENVYRCKEIVEKSSSSYSDNDYALIRLDREVVDREPLRFRKSGKIKDDARLVVIGHPSGLPTKIADGASVRSNSRSIYFVANLDTFGGNSGSAVFNDETGEVEGILVRGELDYVFDYVNRCKVPKVCEESSCRGEDVTRITNIDALKNL